MRRWVLTLASSIVATTLAVAVNLATGGENYLWTWVAIGALIVLGSTMTIVERKPDGTRLTGLDGVGTTRNSVVGPLNGVVVQARDVGSVIAHNYYLAPATIATGDHANVVSNLPTRNPNFAGRESLLEKICQSMEDSKASPTICCLRGMGGVGKTQLAIEFTHRRIGQYQTIWWIPSERPELVPNTLAGLAGALGLAVELDPTILRHRIAAELDRRGNSLLVFDNAEDPNIVRNHVPNFAGHVLVTTRRGGFTAVGSVLDVSVFDRHDSGVFLKDRVPNALADHIDELANLLGDLPLALEQAAAYIDSTNLPLESYLALLRESAGEMMQAGSVIGYEHTLDTVWKLSLKRLFEEQPTAREFFGICAYLAPDQIPLAIFTRNQNSLPPRLTATAANPVSWERMIGTIVDYGLVQRYQDSVHIHRLLQTNLRYKSPEQRTGPLNTLILLRADLPELIQGEPESWPHWQRLLPHIFSAIAWQVEPFDENLLWMLDRTATYLQTQGLSRDAKALLERALSNANDLYGDASHEVSPYLNNLAAVIQDLGDPASALPLAERGLSIAESTYGPDAPEIETHVRNVAVLRRELGSPDAALPLLHRSLAIVEDRYGPDHIRVAVRLNDIAVALRNLGRQPEAASHLERALRIIRKSATFNGHVICSTLHNLSIALLDMGESDRILPVSRQALQIAESTYPADHPAIVSALNVLSRNYLAMDDSKEAISCSRRAFETAKRIVPARHPLLAVTLDHWGLALANLGRTDEAQALFKQTYEIIESIYGRDHPATQEIGRRLDFETKDNPATAAPDLPEDNENA